MNRRKAYPILSVAAILVSILALFVLIYFSGGELEDHWKSFVTTGSHTDYLIAVFSNPKVLTCLAAVLGIGIAAIIVDARAIHREERLADPADPCLSVSGCLCCVVLAAVEGAVRLN